MSAESQRVLAASTLSACALCACGLFNTKRACALTIQFMCTELRRIKILLLLSGPGTVLSFFFFLLFFLGGDLV